MNRQEHARRTPRALLLLERVTSLCSKFETGVAVTGFTLMTVCILIGVFFRYVVKESWTWGEEACRYIMVYSVFLGISLAVREDAHVRVEAVISLTRGRFRRAVQFIGRVFTLAGYLWITRLALDYTLKLRGSGQTSPALRLPMWAIVGVIFVGFLLASLEALTQFWRFCLPGENTPPAEGGDAA